MHRASRYGQDAGKIMHASTSIPRRRSRGIALHAISEFDNVISPVLLHNSTPAVVRSSANKVVHARPSGASVPCRAHGFVPSHDLGLQQELENGLSKSTSTRVLQARGMVTN